jgi:VanZ family protein
MFLWLPVAVYMAGIFIASSLQSPPTGDIPDVDLHAAAYFGLMVLVVRALARGTWAGVTYRTLFIAFVITVLYGVTDEWHQTYVPTRHGELRDLGADAIGAAIGGIAVKAWSIIRRL